jgi:hypothetical protein
VDPKSKKGIRTAIRGEREQRGNKKHRMEGEYLANSKLMDKALTKRGFLAHEGKPFLSQSSLQVKCTRERDRRQMERAHNQESNQPRLRVRLDANLSYVSPCLLPALRVGVAEV